MGDADCRAGLGRLGRTLETLELANDLVRVVVLVNKGADIYALEDRVTGVDLMWKGPWGIREVAPVLPAADSQSAWFDVYSGGWPVLFPNGGDECAHAGAVLPYHGEASVSPWSCEILDEGGDRACAVLECTLARTPCRIRRTISVERGSAVVTIDESIANLGGEPVDYTWTHHPTFGEPFLDGRTRVDAGARTVSVDDVATGAYPSAAAGASGAWPHLPLEDGSTLDLSRAPDPAVPRSVLAYLSDFDEGWFAVTNDRLGVGLGVSWPADVLPYAWLFQESHATSGYPWYRGAYLMALEPSTSVPAQGLAAVIAKTATHRTIEPAARHSLTVRATVHHAVGGVRRITPEGVVEPVAR